MEADSYTSSLVGLGEEQGDEPSNPASWSMPYSLGFQVSLAAVLMLELLLGFSSNLTVLVLYCSQSNLVDSVSNMVTVSLHVLDVAVCVLCLPLTLVVVLLPPGPNLAVLCCFHEACVTFASVATAVNILVISLDRYDISDQLSSGEEPPLSVSSGDIGATMVPAWRNRTLLCIGEQGHHLGPGTYYHLILQVPIFFTTVTAMLFTYSRILRALNFRIGTHMKKTQRLIGPSCTGLHKKSPKKTTKLRRISSGRPEGEQCTADATKQLSHPPLIPFSSATHTAASSHALSSSAPLVTSDAGPISHVPTTMGVQASVSAIITLRRAVRRHRDRRERQRRVFRMSLIIISTFLACWAPLSVVNMLILVLGPSDPLVSVRMWFLALAYGTTVSHPLLYAFTRQKLRRALRAKVKKRVVSLLQVDPSPGATVIHNSWVENRKNGRQMRLEASEGSDRCLAEAV
ncbi:G-protein coupled receptor 22-like isoform X4 [Syngnathus acus]|uniref:G-protein coupled receptor 22-like isoform X4 n=1 Tax=Syngnathus acus TaxID=161584 RepID=UPI001885BAC8|nr:G-protein coupled receptor 22-like isoform X4 [Syngnathus acus]